MKNDHDYIEINRETWNKKTPVHLQSEFYDMKSFLSGSSSLNDIELDLLGDIKGKSILHLQCHFGQDSISLSRMGAKVTGVDLSDKAIETAVQVAAQTNSDTTFICCNIYDLPNHLTGQFDYVFTSYGTIGWLPDLDAWGRIIARYLKPVGKFIIVEFHPVVWMFDNDFEKIQYNYFKDEPIIETETGTYADKAAGITQQTITWNHSLSEVMGALVKNGLQINKMEEFDYSPYNCFNNMEQVGDKKYRIKNFGNKIPLVYAIVASRKTD